MKNNYYFSCESSAFNALIVSERYVYALTQNDNEVYVNQNADLIVKKKEYEKNGTKFTKYYRVNHENVKAKNNAGYYMVRIGGKSFTLHSIVCKGYLGDCPKGKEINHIDEDKSNNSIFNLEYVTHKENMKKYFKDKDSKNHKYYGRYHISTGIFTKPNGEKISITPEEYIEIVRKDRGNAIANKIAKKLGL